MSGYGSLLPGRSGKIEQLVLVRHGETVGNSSVRYHGRTDVVLSELGSAQIRAAAQWLEAAGLRHFAPVFTSPLKRAIESARIIAGERTALIEIDDFAEVDFGIFEGLTAEEIQLCHPAEFALWNRDRLAADYAYPGGESRRAFTARVERGVTTMLASLDEASAPAGPRRCTDVRDLRVAVLVVAHRGVIRTIMRRLAGVEPHIELASIQILQRSQGLPHWSATLDLTAHLAHL
ncbi:MAG: histidine phosphatase family protein [Candidatus Binataceae bacterium]